MLLYARSNDQATVGLPWVLNIWSSASMMLICLLFMCQLYDVWIEQATRLVEVASMPGRCWTCELVWGTWCQATAPAHVANEKLDSVCRCWASWSVLARLARVDAPVLVDGHASIRRIGHACARWRVWWSCSCYRLTGVNSGLGRRRSLTSVMMSVTGTAIVGARRINVIRSLIVMCVLYDLRAGRATHELRLAIETRSSVLTMVKVECSRCLSSPLSSDWTSLIAALRSSQLATAVWLSLNTVYILIYYALMIEQATHSMNSPAPSQHSIKLSNSTSTPRWMVI